MRAFVKEYLVPSTLSCMCEQVLTDVTDELFEDMKNIEEDESLKEDKEEQVYRVQEALRQFLFYPPDFESTDRLSDIESRWAKKVYRDCILAYVQDTHKPFERQSDDEEEEEEPEAEEEEEEEPEAEEEEEEEEPEEEDNQADEEEEPEDDQANLEEDQPDDDDMKSNKSFAK